MLGYAGEKEDVIAGSINVASIKWNALLPETLGAFDQMPESDIVEPWERAADQLEPYFHNFQGTISRDGAKVVTWGKASAWK